MQTGDDAQFPEVDMILWGATGFIGSLLAGYLWPRYGPTGEVRFALGGKSRSENAGLTFEVAEAD